MSRRASPICNVERESRLKLSISPQVGEMSGRTEGALSRQRLIALART